MTKTIYRIRRTDTGEYYSGGSYGIWTNEGGGSYETPAACKCVWRHYEKHCKWMRRDLPKAEIVTFAVVESAGETLPLSP